MSKHRREAANPVCRTYGHTWKRNGYSGTPYPYWETDAYKNGEKYSTRKNEVFQCYCARNCGSFRYQFENWDHELSREEKADIRIRDRAFVRAMIWMLDGEEEDE